MTVQEEKFQRLKAQYDEQAQIIPIACSGLMEYVEQGILRGPEVEGYLLDKLEPYLKVPTTRSSSAARTIRFARGNPPHRRQTPRDHRRQLRHCKAAAQTSGRAAASEPRTGRGQRFVSELAGRAGDAGADAGAFSPTRTRRRNALEIQKTEHQPLEGKTIFQAADNFFAYKHRVITGYRKFVQLFRLRFCLKICYNRITKSWILRETEEAMFAPGDYVIYSVEGVCLVEEAGS